MLWCEMNNPPMISSRWHRKKEKERVQTTEKVGILANYYNFFLHFASTFFFIF
jgi:hypothetical protein